MKSYLVKYTVDFESHNHTEYGEMRVHSNYTINLSDGTEKKVSSCEDAEKFVHDIYEHNPEDELVGIPDFIWEDDNGIGDTCFDVLSAEVYKEEEIEPTA